MSATGSNKFKTRFLAAGIGIAILVIGYLAFRITMQKTAVELYVFDNCGGCNIQNPCKPCKVLTEQINRVSLILKNNKLWDKVNLRTYNTYMNNDNAQYKINMVRIGLEEAPLLPAIVVGKTLISGTIQTDTNLAAVVKNERHIISLVMQFFGFHNAEKIDMGMYDNKTVVEFSLSFCEDCIKTNSYLATINNIKIVRIDLTGSEERMLYEKYCNVYGVPISDYAIPRLFVQKTSLLGFDETIKSLKNVLDGNFNTVKIKLGRNKA